MRKAIIIDDRKVRQDIFLGDEARHKLQKIDGVVFSYEIDINVDIYADYDLIAIHRSALVEQGFLPSVIDYCKRNKKYLITFSGGISKDNYYSDHYIELNSKTFYNIDRLFYFLEDFCDSNNEVQLLRLIYGKNWKLPFIIQYNHLKWQYGDSMPSKVEDRLYDLVDIIGTELAEDEHRRNQEIEILKNQL